MHSKLSLLLGFKQKLCNLKVTKIACITYFVHLIVVCWELSHLIFAFKYYWLFCCCCEIEFEKWNKKTKKLCAFSFALSKNSSKISVTLPNRVYLYIKAFTYFFVEGLKMRILYPWFYHDDFFINCMQMFIN